MFASYLIVVAVVMPWLLICKVSSTPCKPENFLNHVVFSDSSLHFQHHSFLVKGIQKIVEESIPVGYIINDSTADTTVSVIPLDSGMGTFTTELDNG